MNYFFIIGAQRSGTTLLYSLLEQHPDVCMARPKRPEPKYFIRNNKSSEFEYQRSCLQHYKGESICGEKSTSYYEIPEVANRIQAFSATSKIVFMARNPVYRAISNYHFSTLHKLENRTIEATFLEYEPKPSLSFKTSVDPFNYLGRGQYLSQLKPYIEVFGMENIHIVLFEELIEGEGINELCGFLNIESIENLNAIQRINHSGKSVKDTPPAVIKFLHNYYSDHNNAFKAHFNLNLEAWKS